MRKSVTKNYLYNLIYQVLIMIIPFITTPYVSRVLGANNIGIYSYTLSIVTFFILIGSLGISLYGQREIAYVQEDKVKRTNTFWEIFLLRVISLWISLVIYYFIFIAHNNEYKIYYKILTIELIANIIDISWFFQGIEDFKKTIFRNTIVKVISVCLIFLLVKNQKDFYLYFCIYVLSTFIGNLSLWIYVPKYLEKIQFKNLNLIQHLKPTISLFIPQIAVQIYTILDRTMLGMLIEDKSEVGFYEQSQKIIKLALTVISSLSTVMLPRIANNFAMGNENKIKDYMEESIRFVLLLAWPMIFGIWLISDIFVPIYFGNGFDKVIVLLQILSPILLIIGLSTIIGIQYLLPTNRQKKYTIAVTTGSIINILFNFILIPNFKSVGAAIGTIIAEITVTCIEIIMIKKEINLVKVFINSYKYLICSTIMFILGYFLKMMQFDSQIVKLLIIVLISIITYSVLLIIFRDNFVLKICKKIIKKINLNGGKK